MDSVRAGEASIRHRRVRRSPSFFRTDPISFVIMDGPRSLLARDHCPGPLPRQSGSGTCSLDSPAPSQSHRRLGESQRQAKIEESDPEIVAYRGVPQDAVEFGTLAPRTNSWAQFGTPQTGAAALFPKVCPTENIESLKWNETLKSMEQASSPFGGDPGTEFLYTVNMR
jgi:hypothetical protein